MMMGMDSWDWIIGELHVCRKRDAIRGESRPVAVDETMEKGCDLSRRAISSELVKVMAAEKDLKMNRNSHGPLEITLSESSGLSGVDNDVIPSGETINLKLPSRATKHSDPISSEVRDPPMGSLI
jgi:hypothetical protein